MHRKGLSTCLDSPRCCVSFWLCKTQCWTTFCTTRMKRSNMHGESRHVDRPFLCTYVPNSDADNVFYFAGGVSIVRVCNWCGRLLSKFAPGSFSRHSTPSRHYVLTLFCILIKIHFKVILTSLLRTYILFGRLEYDTTLS